MLLFIYYSPSEVTNTLIISSSINSLAIHLSKNSKQLFFTQWLLFLFMLIWLPLLRRTSPRSFISHSTYIFLLFRLSSFPFWILPRQSPIFWQIQDTNVMGWKVSLPLKIYWSPNPQVSQNIKCLEIGSLQR